MLDKNIMFTNMLKDINESLRERLDFQTKKNRELIDKLYDIHEENYINCNKCTDDAYELHCEPRDAYDAFRDLKNALTRLLNEYDCNVEGEFDD